MADHTSPHRIRIGDLTIANDRPLTLIAGPCAIESRSHALEMGQALTEITRKLGLGLIYKSSFDKANRTSIRSNRGVGMEEGLPILCIVMFAISIQFFLMGLLAELLVRTYHESQDKAIYAVRERIGFNGE